MKTELLKDLRKKFAEYYKVVSKDSKTYKYIIVEKYEYPQAIAYIRSDIRSDSDSDRWTYCTARDLAELKLMVRALSHQFMKRKIKELREEGMNRKLIYPW